MSHLKSRLISARGVTDPGRPIVAPGVISSEHGPSKFVGLERIERLLRGGLARPPVGIELEQAEIDREVVRLAGFPNRAADSEWITSRLTDHNGGTSDRAPIVRRHFGAEQGDNVVWLPFDIAGRKRISHE